MTDTTKAVEIRSPGASGRDIALRDAASTKPTWIAPGGKALTPELARALAIVGAKYDLDPAVGEVMLVDTKVYITLEGYLAIAHSFDEFAGLETWPLSEDERKVARIAADEHAWGCRVYRKDWKVPAVEIGRASERNIPNPRIKPYVIELAKARAVRRALKLAFRRQLTARFPGFDREVDPETGEVIEDTGVRVAPRALPREAEPTRADIHPDWPRFWAKIKAWGMTRDDVHAALKVDSVKDFEGSLAEALDVCALWLDQRQQDQRVQARAEIGSDPLPWEPTEAEFALIAPNDELLAVEVPTLDRDDTDDQETGAADVPRAPTTRAFAHRGECFAAILADFKLSSSQALKALGYSSWSDVHMSPTEIYQAIAAIKRADEGGNPS